MESMEEEGLRSLPTSPQIFDLRSHDRRGPRLVQAKGPRPREPFGRRRRPELSLTSHRGEFVSLSMRE